MPPPPPMTAAQRAVHAQAQVKRQSEELNEYMMDMRTWEKEVGHMGGCERRAAPRRCSLATAPAPRHPTPHHY